MLLDFFFRRLVKRGRLTVIRVNGDRKTYGFLPGPQATIRLHDRSVARRIALNPTLGAAEAYMDGRLTMEDGCELYDLLAVATINLEGHWRPGILRLHVVLGRWTRRFWQYNPIRRAKRNVAHPYDLSDALYALFLDSNRQYSCAYFDHPNQDLETAQLRKMQHIASKLLLEPGQAVLDIGSGWGGLAMHLARASGASVRGLTLSEEQFKVATHRAAASGMADQVSFALQDYRHENRLYDRIVSIGMFEHVGLKHYNEYFTKAKQLLKPNGVMLLHTIGRWDGPGSTDPFIRKYVFPGAYTPALSEIMPAVERSGLVVTDVEVLRLHYADTLRAWRRRFQANWDKAAELYDERFCRMWEFYLGGCEVAFRHLGLVVFQIQLATRQEAVPLVRDYITDSDRGHHSTELAAE